MIPGMNRHYFPKEYMQLIVMETQFCEGGTKLFHCIHVNSGFERLNEKTQPAHRAPEAAPIQMPIKFLFLLSASSNAQEQISRFRSAL